MLTYRTIGFLSPVLDCYSGVFTGGHVGREVAADHIVVFVFDHATVVGAVVEVRFWIDGAMTDRKYACLFQKRLASLISLIVDALNSISSEDDRNHAVFTTEKNINNI